MQNTYKAEKMKKSNYQSMQSQNFNIKEIAQKEFDYETDEAQDDQMADVDNEQLSGAYNLAQRVEYVS